MIIHYVVTGKIMQPRYVRSNVLQETRLVRLIDYVATAKGKPYHHSGNSNRHL